MPNIYPNVLLDLFPYCNAKCTFCSYHHKTRSVKPMPSEIYEKVIDEIGDSGECCEIMPYYYGEPLINPNLFETCDYICDHAPNAKISISTNAAYLTEDNVDKLLGVRNLYFLNFSAYAGTKETYERVMGLDHETLTNIEGAIRMFVSKRPTVRLCVGATSDPRFVTPEDGVELVRRFGNIVSFHPISFNYQHGLANTRTCPDNTPCNVPFTNSVIYSDGKVGMCCFDVNGDLVIGDVTKTSLKDAIYSDLAQKYRHVHANGCKDVIPLCRSCTQPR